VIGAEILYRLHSVETYRISDWSQSVKKSGSLKAAESAEFYEQKQPKNNDADLEQHTILS